jgi:hypothetical protein
MGIILELLFVGIIIVAIVNWRKKRREKRSKADAVAIAILKTKPAHEVALKILTELAQKGYNVDFKMSAYVSIGGAVGDFSINKGTTSDSGGKIHIASDPDDLANAAHGLIMNNIEARGGHYYAIQNDNIGLLVRADTESQEVPPLIKIAATVIKNSRYKFEHPNWLYKDNGKAKEYLNVMFQ